MSLLEQQVAQIRREMELLKKSQVVIYDSAPKEPTKQSIWREGSTVKWWDGKEWKTQSSGGITDFSTTVVFSSSSRLNVSWSAGAMNIGTATGLGTFAIGSGSFTMSSNTFLYWAPDTPNAIQTTSNAQDAITSGGIIIAVAIPNSDTSATSAAIKTFGNSQNDLITADQIVANSITSNKLAAALVYAGSLTLATNGIIKGGQTAFNTGTGFFLGYSSGAYKFSIGDSANKYFTYDGTNMVINGGVIRTKATGDRVEMENNYIKTFGTLGNITIRGDTTGIEFYHAGTTVTGILNYDSTTIPGIGSITGFKLNQQLSCTGAIRSQIGFGGPIMQLTSASGNCELSSYSSDTMRFSGAHIWMSGSTWSINGYSGLGGELYSDGSHLYYKGNLII